MTTAQTAQIKKAIAECNRYIAIESPRSPDLCPAETAELLAFYISHKAKLEAMLAT